MNRWRDGKNMKPFPNYRISEDQKSLSNKHIEDAFKARCEEAMKETKNQEFCDSKKLKLLVPKYGVVTGPHELQLQYDLKVEEMIYNLTENKPPIQPRTWYYFELFLDSKDLADGYKHTNYSLLQQILDILLTVLILLIQKNRTYILRTRN
jgi:hypothetical protein